MEGATNGSPPCLRIKAAISPARRLSNERTRSPSNAGGKTAAAIVDERGLRQVTDTSEIDAAVDRILAANQDKVAEYRSGKDKLFGFFVGQTMKAMAGKGNPGLINETLKRRLA